jgi:hypothetical protein
MPHLLLELLLEEQVEVDSEEEAVALRAQGSSPLARKT